MTDESRSRVEKAVATFARGGLVIVTDDNDREDEGDLFVAASLCTPEKMAFIIRNTSGIVCAPLSVEEARRLHLDPMVALNDAPLGTAFTVSVDVRHGFVTGISAEERANTVRTLANHNATASDFVRPGHVFPLIARAGGVLMRPGHTEACVDLCGLSGVPPVGVLAELMNDDGTVMHGLQIATFAEKHRLVVLSVSDLIAYRQAHNKLVERVGEFMVQTEIGPMRGYDYVTPFEPVHHMALVHGHIGDGKDVLIRLHHHDFLRDVLGGGEAVHAALRRIKEEGRGMLVLLCDGAVEGRAAEPPHDQRGNSETARARQWREIGVGAQILKDLGVSSIRLLTSAQHRYVGLAGLGIETVAAEAVETDRTVRH